MKNLLILFLLSLGFIGNSYAESFQCPDVIIDKDHMESIRASGCSSSILQDFWCKEGFTKSNDGKRCIRDSKIDIGQLTVSVTDHFKVEVFKEEKHIFSYDCRHHIFCMIFSTSKENPAYKISDGYIEESDDLVPLFSIDNLQKTYDGKLIFLVEKIHPRGTVGQIEQHAINIINGTVEERIYKWNRYLNGMPEPSDDEPCVNMFLC